MGPKLYPRCKCVISSIWPTFLAHSEHRGDVFGVELVSSEPSFCIQRQDPFSHACDFISREFHLSLEHAGAKHPEVFLQFCSSRPCWRVSPRPRHPLGVRWARALGPYSGADPQLISHRLPSPLLLPLFSPLLFSGESFPSLLRFFRALRHVCDAGFALKKWKLFLHVSMRFMLYLPDTGFWLTSGLPTEPF